MPKEVITLHLGQAGCQVGQTVWEQICTEHSIHPSGSIQADSDHDPDDLTYESFFQATSMGQHVPRAVFADTDPRSKHSLRDPNWEFSGLFHPDNVMAWKQDSKNNFFEGYMTAGTKMHIAEDIMDRVRVQMDACSNLQGFFIFHALGGGTGSGVGSKLLEDLHDQYSKKMVLQPAIFPSVHLSNCIVEPYNCVLALHKMKDLVDLTMPLDNEKAYELVRTNLLVPNPTFHHLNIIMSQFVSACTASLRFPTELGASLDEIVQNLVPFPQFRYPVMSLSPLRSPKSAKHEEFSVAEIVTDLFEGKSILCDCDKILKLNRYLSAVVLLRGTVKVIDKDDQGLTGPKDKPVSFSEVMASLRTLVKPSGQHRQAIRGHPFLGDKMFKVGILGQNPQIPPRFQDTISSTDRQGAMLGNSTAVRQLFVRQYVKFLQLFFHKAYVWQYLEAGGEEDTFHEAKESVYGIIEGYEQTLRDCVEMENESSDGAKVQLEGKTERRR